MMIIEWHKINKIDNNFELTIEGSVTPKDIYNIVKELNDYEEILISSFDMETNNYDPLIKEFNFSNIEYIFSNHQLIVRKEFINLVFEFTGFGQGQDSYTLIPADRQLCGNHNLYVSYVDIPDLLVRCKCKSYLESILTKLLNIIEKRT